MKACLCGCGRMLEINKKHYGKKNYFNFECYQRSRRSARTVEGSLDYFKADTIERQEAKELLEWAKIGDRECMKILRDRDGLMTFHDGRAWICMENARL